MEEVLLSKVLNFRNKSYFYHLGRRVEEGEGKVTAFRFSQLIESANFQINFQFRFHLKSLSATTDLISVPFENQDTPHPPPSRKTLLPLPLPFPSEEW